MIRVVRGQRVILDADLALVYGVLTKALNQAVKRNREKFPQDFIFRLTREVAERCRRLRSQTVTLKRGQHIKHLPSHKQIGFHVRETAASYRVKSRRKTRRA
jgi:hypothetical protein